MAIYKAYMRKVVYYVATVEADSVEEAEEAFRDGVYDDIEADRDYNYSEYELIDGSVELEEEED